MSHNTSYPSPTAAQVGEGAGPFYTQASQRIPPQDDLELSAQLSRDMENTANQSPNDGQGMHRIDQKYSQPIYPPHLQNFHPMTPQQGNPGQGGPITPGPIKSDEDSARKKSKVSRACDECRRKKIRCDAESDTPGHPKCSNCNRTSTTCQFSRQPQKRGPSKGYIKELADRVEQMEKKMIGETTPYAAMSPSQSSPQAMNDFGMTPELPHGLPSNRKRTHSMSENLSAQAYAQSQLHNAHEGYPANGNWHGHDNSGQVLTYEIGKPQAPTANMNYASAIRAGQSTTNNSQKVAPEAATMIMGMDWQNDLIDEYLRTIHPTYPLLGDSAADVRLMLNPAGKELTSAFFGALYLAVTRSSAKPLHPHGPTLDVVKDALTAISTENPQKHTVKSNALVFLQTCLLVVIALDTGGPSGKQEHIVVPRSGWYGLALGMIQQLMLHTTEFPEQYAKERSFLIYGRRAYLIAVVLDRFYATGYGVPFTFQSMSTILSREDPALLGQRFYQLTRLSSVLRDLINISALPKLLQTEIRIEEFMFHHLDLFSQSAADDLDQQPILRAAHLYVKLFQAYLLAPATTMHMRSNMFGTAFNLAKFLKSEEYPQNPLTHHFIALVALTLKIFRNNAAIGAKVEEGLSDLSQAITQRHILSNLSPNGSWEGILLEDIKSGAGASVGDIKDWVGLVQGGYLRKYQ